MTNYTKNILIKPISLSQTQFVNIKKNLSQLEWCILLESASEDHIDSRWSIYSAHPITTIETKDSVTKVKHKNICTEYITDPFDILEELRKKTFHSIEDTLPFTGGVLGYIGYEMGYKIEKIANEKQVHGLNLPELAVGLYDWALIHDNQTQVFHLLSHRTKGNINNIKESWKTRFDWLMQQSRGCVDNIPFRLLCEWSSNMSKQSYHSKFDKVQNYILNGDCYQINLAQRFQSNYQGDEYQAYQHLIMTNHPPFAAFMRLSNQIILSLSPERFLKLRNGTVESKPIKGTRPRFCDQTKDETSKDSLINSEKDRAENLMIVDLLRNDIGRVCKPGSVTVPKLFDIETFPAVHHLVSTVIGILDPVYSSEDLLRASFPGGSITGAPKIRAMDIIAELEPNKRQVYCGSIGYINGNGELDMNISIRTLVCHEQKIYCWAGGGLVADSNIDLEYQECFDKVSKILPTLTAFNKE